MAGRRTAKPGWFLGPLEEKAQRRAALICGLAAVVTFFLARISMQLPPAWGAVLHPTLWLLPFWAGGLSVMFISTTMTLERPQHARWHQGLAAILVAGGLCMAYLPPGGIDPRGWPDLLLADHRLRVLAATAFVFSMIGGAVMHALFAARALIVAALLVFSVIWFDTGAVRFMSGAATESARPFVFLLYGLVASWAPLLAWTSVRSKRES